MHKNHKRNKILFARINKMVDVFLHDIYVEYNRLDSFLSRVLCGCPV